MGLNLGTQNIFELGNMISKKLSEYKVTNTSELIVKVNKHELLKIDEDLFYRREHDKDEKFTPSDKEITIKFDNINIKITLEDD